MLFGMAGLKGAGKDTAADVLVNEYGFTKVAFADSLRQLLLILDPIVWANPDEAGMTVRLSEVVFAFGWDYSKRTYTEVRRLMQIFGTEVGRNSISENLWVDVLVQNYPDIGDFNSKYVIIDCRFPNEAEFIYELGGEVIWVDRPGLTSDGHESESLAMRDKANLLLHNDEGIEKIEEDMRFLITLRGGTRV